MKEDLRKEKEIASFGGMGLPGRAGGYGGGSGPLRDDQGNIVTDLNKVGCLDGVRKWVCMQPLVSLSTL